MAKAICKARSEIASFGFDHKYRLCHVRPYPADGVSIGSALVQTAAGLCATGGERQRAVRVKNGGRASPSARKLVAEGNIAGLLWSCSATRGIAGGGRPWPRRC